MDSKENQDILIISGDFNAKMGGKKNSDEDGIVGNAGLGERNERGTFLVDFAISNQLTIKKTPCFRSTQEDFTPGHHLMGKSRTKLITS